VSTEEPGTEPTPGEGEPMPGDEPGMTPPEPGTAPEPGTLPEEPDVIEPERGSDMEEPGRM
jgi:hypothetical protein